jgi:peptidoglycan L-alanyl-D-glutamate endopeptidase CwlK
MSTLGLKDLLDKAEPKLKQLHPVVASKARQLIAAAFKEGINIIITQGYRSKAEQDALYAQGRSKPGKIVTNAPGGHSYHNYGLAFDIAVLNPDGSINWNVDKNYYRVGALGQSLGLEWGGSWKKFPDYPHFQYTFGLSIDDLLAGKRPPQGDTVTKTVPKQEVKAAQSNAPKQATKINGIPVVGEIEIVNVKNAAYVCDKPSTNSKNLATVKLGTRLPISGSVPGWWEVIYNGQRAYVNEKFGKKVK